jgi:hypothetical protein
VAAPLGGRRAILSVERAVRFDSSNGSCLDSMVDVREPALTLILLAEERLRKTLKPLNFARRNADIPGEVPMMATNMRRALRAG